MSEFFRTTLSKGKDYITVREEKSHIESYLEIQQFRYQDIMDYEIEIGGGTLSVQYSQTHLTATGWKCAYHGIKNKRGGGMIRITGWKEGQKIYF